MAIIDTIYTFRFLKILSTKWENTDAYKLGIIDKVGKPLKKSSELTKNDEKNAYTPFVRLIFKLKRLMGTIPGGRSATARYGAAIALIKEHSKEVEDMGISLKVFEDGIKKYTDKLEEEVTTSTSGIDGNEQPLGKKGEVKKRKKKKGDEVNNVVDKDSNESTSYRYQVIGGVLIRIDEKKRVVKKRVIGNKRQKKREFKPTKRITRTGSRKLRGAKKAKWKRSHKKAYRKAHTGSATHKRKRSMKKSNKYNQRSKK